MSATQTTPVEANPFTCADFAINTPVRFDIIDGHTGCKVGEAKTRAGASRSVDRRDNAYGAYRFRAVAVWEA